MNKQNGTRYLGSLVGMLLIFFGAIGWVLNIVKLWHMCCTISGELVIRALGIPIAPLGAILGFLG